MALSCCGKFYQMDPLSAILPNIIKDADYPFTKKQYINSLLKNSLHTPEEYRQYSRFGIERNGATVDKKTEYYYNNFGYRSNDWTEKSKILAVGCSNTFAVGVPIEHSWTQILSKYINNDIRNLSRPGASIMELVSKMFAYFKEFGNPETILCLFPDPFRIRVPGNSNLTCSENGKNQIVCDIYLEKYGSLPLSERPKYLKKPYNYEDILPLELSVFLSSMAIHQLEQYCKSNNIKLIWSSWDSHFSSVLNTINEKIFDNFFYDSQLFIDDKSIDSKCHDDYSKNVVEYFYSGLDNEDDPSIAHPGVHKHIHIAESFYKQIGNK